MKKLIIIFFFSFFCSIYGNAQKKKKIHIYSGRNMNILAFCAVDEDKPHHYAFKFYSISSPSQEKYRREDFKKYISENPTAYFNSVSFADTVAIYKSDFYSFLGTNRYRFSILFNASPNTIVINDCVREGAFRSPLAEGKTVLKRIE